MNVSRRRVLGLVAGVPLAVSGCAERRPGSEADTTSSNTPLTEPATLNASTEGQTTARFASSARTTQRDHLPTPVRGNTDAEVTVAAYVDFACPHCQEYERNTVPKLLSNYVEPGKIRYEHHDFPVPVDSTRSWSAANAAREAQVLGGNDTFWKFLRRLFEKQYALSLEFYADVARDVGLDGRAVRQAAERRTHQATIEADKERGKELGVMATPTVVVDGSPVATDAYSLLEKVIDAKLEN